ncbi:unnamed protein product [Victoria cruziana]
MFHAAMEPVGDRCISFAKTDDDVDEAEHEVIISIFTCCIADPGPKFVTDDADDAAIYTSNFSFFNSYFSDCALVSSHPLSSEGREAYGGFVATATTTLHRGRPHLMHIFESLPPMAIEPDSSSLESLPVIELKPLPHTLKYVYQSDDDSLPVNISSVLSSEEEKSLLAVLNGYKKAIEWKVADLRGIDSSFCMHHIYTLEDCKLSREIQRRLNLVMKEVVKKELIK